LSSPVSGLAVVLLGADLVPGPSTAALVKPAGDILARAAAADGFKGKAGSFVDIVAPDKLALTRLLVAGCGKPADWKELD
ncbi:M17 family peptidase N-terminal domain-containing protein, partial [Streptococcus pneumoniae]|uniref:M17 family peptidase N-terminal domain-containing protein n=1 Tax=Streptococcus pneumoniae TaxID=1313 RepID=UPI0019546F31